MSSDEDMTISKKRYSVLQNRKTYWYTVNEIKNKSICPSCGRSIEKFKNLTAHVKRCFSIKKIGPIYRLHGYVECKCGLLIADNTKAQKLHVCMGEVPAFEPDLSYVRKLPESDKDQVRNQDHERDRDHERDHEEDRDGDQQQADDNRSHQLERELLQPKPWIRNFVSPFKLDIENIHVNSKPEPRVRNFDMPVSKREPKNVSVYSIGTNNGTIYVTGRTSQSGNQNVILIKKRALRLPQLKGYKCS
ncbi:PREDICTED: uncharacterized protein LOC108616665 [Drosophila arizonae]|uniref:Uncharacterized protein LOC108616665 n=1 Tax=Drosophila arizonae TaxID=7263 RepID=A0ABM1PK00_DROAR|nr:PREDICTED: uncharacterized protein LOC108616665 [Drosophila arizonae]